MHRAIKSCVLGMCILGAVQISAQKVGIETLSPDSTLSIKNKIEIGGTHGDLLFTDDMGSITFPATTIPNEPMIHMFSSGTSNANRMILAHSPLHPDWGLEYRDTSDRFHFIRNDTSILTVDLLNRRIGMGEAPLTDPYLLNVWTSNERRAGTFLSLGDTTLVSTGIYGGAYHPTSDNTKTGGIFAGQGGTGVNYGVYSYALEGETNIGLYSHASGGSTNVSAWLEAGNVLVEDRVLIGASSQFSGPDGSALLELRSTDAGLLLPRLTTTEREAIILPAEGLMVYDKSLAELYVYDGSSWQPVAGSGGSHWTEDTTSPVGIFYDGGNVGIGVSSISPSRRLEVQTLSSDFAGYFFNNTSSMGTIAAVWATALSSDSGDKRGGSFDAQSGSGTNFGVWARALTGGTNIGVYGTASGGETDRAAWFDEGDVVVDEKMLIGSSSMTQEPESSAILELNSTTGGLLFPRMTSTQRTNILSPPGGLVVYDNTLSSLYYHDGSAWQSLTGGGGHWVTDGSGIHYDAGTVGIGASAQGYIALNIDSNDDQIGINTVSNHTGSLQKFGVQSIATSLGTGIRYGVFSRAEAPSSGSAATYGVYGLASQGTSAGPAYGIFGDVSGSGSGERWAGYFDGSVRTSEQMVIGSETAGMPEPSAILDLQSTDKGLLLPRMTASQRQAIGSPATGLIVYDTDSSSVMLRRSGSWTNLMGPGGSGGGHWAEDISPEGIFYDGGNVGIGDEASPISRLYLESGVEPYGAWIITQHSGSASQFGLIASTSSNGSGVRTGVKGIGHANSSNSASAYGVYGEANQHSSAANVYGVYGVAGGSGTGVRWAGYFVGNTKVEDNFYIGDKVEISPTGHESASEILLRDNDGTPTIVMHGNQFTSQGAQFYMADDDGDITLLLDSDYASHGGGGLISLKDENSNNRIVIEAKETSSQGGAMKMYDAAGNLTIELDADFGGDGRVITDELEIKGGSDLAEYFATSDVSSHMTPGRVVIIDAENPGQVKLSGTAYDKKVVGIISGANGIKPGMMMGQRESIAFGDVPVAIAGRVYVKVDETAEAVEPGDFLTTSQRTGMAMRVDDWDAARGAILGKALTYADDNDYVLVLVHLQ